MTFMFIYLVLSKARDGANVAHVYPDALGTAWVHALLLDLSALGLVLGSVTGLCMGWQMRRVRRVGWIVLAAGLFLAVCILAEVVPARLP